MQSIRSFAQLRQCVAVICVCVLLFHCRQCMNSVRRVTLIRYKRRSFGSLRWLHSFCTVVDYDACTGRYWVNASTLWLVVSELRAFKLLCSQWNEVIPDVEIPALWPLSLLYVVHQLHEVIASIPSSHQLSYLFYVPGNLRRFWLLSSSERWRFSGFQWWFRLRIGYLLEYLDVKFGNKLLILAGTCANALEMAVFDLTWLGGLRHGGLITLLQFILVFTDGVVDISVLRPFGVACCVHDLVYLAVLLVPGALSVFNMVDIVDVHVLIHYYLVVLV